MNKVIVVDPGHGGRDPGAVYEPYVKPGAAYYEKELVMPVSCHLAGYLCGYCHDDITYQVLLTRTTDRHVGLSRRILKANMSMSDILVSIHVNDVRPSVDPANVEGASVLYYHTSEAGFDLADNVLAEILKTGLLKRFSDGLIPSGVKILKKTSMPAILVELGFIRNYHDLEVITDEDNQAKLAYAIFKGIHYWITFQGHRVPK